MPLTGSLSTATTMSPTRMRPVAAAAPPPTTDVTIWKGMTREQGRRVSRHVQHESKRDGAPMLVRGRGGGGGGGRGEAAAEAEEEVEEETDTNIERKDEHE